MKREERAQMMLRKRKFLLALPLFVIPFLTLIFWSLGGGKAKAETVVEKQGLNLKLPDARLEEDKNENKMSFYDQAAKDSHQRKKILNEFNASNITVTERLDSSLHTKLGYDPSPYGSAAYKDTNEEKVYQRLARLNQQLNQSANKEAQKEPAKLGKTDATVSPSLDKSEVDRLETMMEAMKEGDVSDPEATQLTSMMDKILDIQHPERVKERMREQVADKRDNNKRSKGAKENFKVSLLRNGSSKNNLLTSGAFYPLALPAYEPIQQNAVEAIVDQPQSLVSGSTVKMRLATALKLNDVTIPAGTSIWGYASLNEERLHIDISTVRSGASIYAASLSVYDMDGMEGIHIPGSITRETVKMSSDQALQGLELSAIEPSLKGQAANAGLQTLKSIVGKKTRLVRVHVKPGYRVLLKDKNTDN